MRVGFHIDVIPSIFTDHGLGIQTTIETFQMTSSYEIDKEHVEDIIEFNYKISPIAVRYKNEKESIFSFLINICAIIGGIFTLAGIVDSIVHKGSKIIFKNSINKLS